MEFDVHVSVETSRQHQRDFLLYRDEGSADVGQEYLVIGPAEAEQQSCFLLVGEFSSWRWSESEHLYSVWSPWVHKLR